MTPRGQAVRGQAVRAMLGATALWEASGGVVAGLATGGAAAGAFVELGAGIVLTTIAAARGLRPLTVAPVRRPGPDHAATRGIASPGQLAAMTCRLCRPATDRGTTGPATEILSGSG